MLRSSTPLAQRTSRIDWLLLDVDGVLTDGRITYDNHGIEQKSFHVRDGFGLRVWHQIGKRSAVITGRTSNIVTVRATELGITAVYQGAGDKLAAFRRLLEEQHCRPEQVCMIGDDLPDAGILANCGLAIGVSDAAAEIRSMADLVTKSAGGAGAVREAIEYILGAQGHWQQIVRQMCEVKL